MNKLFKHLKKILEDKARRKKLRKVFGFLAVFVLIITAFAMKIPAMTLEKDVAQKESIPTQTEDFVLEETDEKASDDQVPNYEENKEEDYIEENIDKEKQNPKDEEDFLDQIEDEEEPVQNKFDFSFKEGSVRANISLKGQGLSENTRLEVNSLDDKKPARMSLSSKGQIDDKSRRDQEIKDNFEGKVTSISYIDISFYDDQGDYIPVKDKAEVSLNLEGLGINKSEEEDISIAHFTDYGLEIYEPEFIVTDGKLDQVSFETDGFSVFAIVTHETWKRVQVEDELYTIITSNETPYTLEYDNNNVVAFEADLANDFVEVADRENTESPYNFKDLNTSKKYKRFVIKNEGNNEYSIRATDFKKYLAISGSDLILSDDPYRFKFYENSKSNGGIRIFGNEGLQILVFDPIENKFKVVKSYEESEEYISDFFIVLNRIEYKVLTHSEIDKLPQTSELVIISDNGQDRNDGKRGFLDSYIDPKYNPVNKYRDSTALEKDGDTYTIMEDQFRDGRYKEPDLVKFTKKDGNYFLQDKNGGYLYLEKTDNGEIKSLNKDSVNDERELMFTIEKTGNADEVFLYNINYGNNNTNKNFKFNLESRWTINGFQAYNTTAANSKLKLATPYPGEYEEKEKLIDAAIPDGYYAITNEDASRLMYRRYAADFQANDYTRDVDDKLQYLFSNGNLRNNGLLDQRFHVFKITNQSDGTVIIDQQGINNGNSGNLRITSNRLDNTYNRLAFHNNVQTSADDNRLKIVTSKEDPSFFYIYNNYGWIDFDSTTNRWSSNPVTPSKKVRLYKVDLDGNGNYKNNKRFTHPGIKDGDTSDKVETGVLADIQDGNYVIGHGSYPSKNDTEKKDFHVLQDDKSAKDAYFYFDEGLSEDFPIVVRKDDLVELDSWDIKQKETPGNYLIRSTKKDPSGNKIGSLDLNGDKIRIYKAEDPKDPRVLITDGTYRLRYDYNKKEFISVNNSEALEDGDYHYLGGEDKHFLKLDLTLPEDYNGASWKNPKDPEDKGVELAKKAYLAEMRNEDGTYSFANIYPKGYSKELGPIGKIYNSSRGGGTIPVNSNPYSNLYRLYLSPDELPPNLGLDQYEDIEEFAEYAFMGYRLDLGGKTYHIDKDASFILSEDKNSIKINDKDMPEIPLGTEDIVLKTDFKELSAPLYFYFNPWEGILDVERGISAKELKSREEREVYGNKDKISPIMAEGRVLFPEAENSVSNNGKSAMTMDRDVNDTYRTLRNIRFPNDEEDPYNGQYQLMFNRVYEKDDKKLGPPRYDNVQAQILSNELKSSAIDWLYDNPSKAGILKYDISTRGKDLDEISSEEIIIDKIDQENINFNNLGIDFIDLEKNSGGFSLSGILYTDTNRLTIEKHFENINVDELKALQGVKNQKFHINLYEEDIDKDRADSSSYNDLLYSLSFDGVKENEVRYRTPFPKVGEDPLSYWDIERVGTSFNTWPSENKALVLWSLPVKKNTNFAVEEKNFHLGISGKNLDTKLGYLVLEDGKKVRKEKKWSTKEEELDQVGRDGLKYEGVLNSDVSDLVDLTNHYSSYGSVQVETLIDGLPLKGREFKLYKDSVKEENRVNKDISYISSHKGTVNFSDLKPGSYILLEDTNDDLYEDIGQISFTIEEDTYKMTQGSVEPPNDLVDFNYDENLIKVNYKSKYKNLKITKIFEGMPITDIRYIVRSDSEGSYDDSFKIIVKGYNKDDELVGERTLTEAQSLGIVENSLSWHIKTLEKNGEKIPIFKEDKFNSDDLDYITIEEINYDHHRYPAVKRKLFVGDGEKILENNLYKIKGGELQEKEGQVKPIEIRNAYTNGFSIQINVRGKDYTNKEYKSLEDMGFELYGSIDELSGDEIEDKTVPVDDGYQYLLKKSKTDENGQAEIDNLSFHDGNKYYLKHSDNPFYKEENEEESAYYSIEDLLEIDVGDGEISLAKDDYSIEGKYKISAVDKAGVFVIDIDFERTNYRLPETGGLGIKNIYKVGAMIIVLATTLLIYKNKK